MGGRTEAFVQLRRVGEHRSCGGVKGIIKVKYGTEAESDIPVHVRVHVHEGKISGRGLRYQGVVRVWSAAKSSHRY